MATNPQRVVEAYTSAGMTVGGVHFREFTSGALLMMQRIDCPLLEADPTKRAARTMADMDVLRLVFVLTHPSLQCFELLEVGLAEFDRATIKFADTIPLQLMPEMGDAIRNLFARAMSTSPSADDPAEKKTATTRSPSSRKKATATAGS